MQEKMTVNSQVLLFLFLAGFVSAVLSFFVCVRFGTRLIKRIAELRYHYLVWSVIIFILLLNLISNGVLGLVVCISGALIARVAIRGKVMKSHAMGCLIVPTILFYLTKFM
jgi:TctA family transporter